jgi:protein involved in polysaccharide export with SLBB domain
MIKTLLIVMLLIVETSLHGVAQNPARSTPSKSDGICVAGEVARPTMIVSTAPITLSQGIERAGGVLPYANGDVLLLFRKGRAPVVDQTPKIDLKAVRRGTDNSPPLQPGDTLIVESRRNERDLHFSDIVPCQDRVGDLKYNR